MESSEPGSSKGVRWAFDIKAIDQSFASDSSGQTVEATTSTLAFANAQLIAHGFIRSPGLQLQSLSLKDQEVAAKCLMGMLGQRMEDVNRAENVSTKLRTLTYDHERLKSLHKVAEDRFSYAEKEAELAKSKMNATGKTLTDEQLLHKQTSATLQKTQSALQFARSTSQNEVKRKEKDVEKVLDRWSKICSEQARLGSVGTGMACANLAIVEDDKSPAEDHFVEQALSDLESAKSRLTEENDAFRDVLLSAARGLQSLLHELEPSTADSPPLLSAQQFYSSPKNASGSLYDPAAHALNAHVKLKDIISSIRRRVEAVQSQAAQRQAARDREKVLQQEIESRKAVSKELERMKDQVDELNGELVARQQLETKNLLTEVEAESKRLAEREVQLQQNQDEFSEAAARLGSERASLELEWHQLEEERAAWKKQQALNLLADTPEKRREKDIERELGRSPPQQASVLPMEAVKARAHHVKRPRSSEEIPLPAKTKPKVVKGKEKKVNFGSAVPSGIPTPVRSTSPTYPPPVSATLSQPGPPESPPRKSSNPFEEVLLRSAQRPKPVFSDDLKGLPRFQPVAPLQLDAEPGPSSDTRQNNANLAVPSSEELPAEVPVARQSRMGKSSRSHKRSPPGKSRTVNSSQTTPPIFTHRRVVGKRHQYAPAVPSPLSKIIKAADASFDRSSEDDHDEISSSPSQVVTKASTGREATKKSIQPIQPLTIVQGGEEEDDEDGVWLPVEPDVVGVNGTQEADDNPLYTGPNLAPLTEDDLIIAPKPKLSMTGRKGPIASKPPFRPAVPPSRGLKPGAAAKPKEKENSADGSGTRQGSKQRRVESSPLKAIVTGKVVMGRSATRVSANAKAAQPQVIRPATKPVKTTSARPQNPRVP